MRSGLLFLLFGSNLAAGVGDFDPDLLGSLDDFSSFLGEGRSTRELTL